jgi:hypothetical protein
MLVGLKMPLLKTTCSIKLKRQHKVTTRSHCHHGNLRGQPASCLCAATPPRFCFRRASSLVTTDSDHPSLATLICAAAGQQVDEGEEDACEEAKAEPTDSAVDPHAHGQPDPVRCHRSCMHFPSLRVRACLPAPVPLVPVAATANVTATCDP